MAFHPHYDKKTLTETVLFEDLLYAQRKWIYNYRNFWDCQSRNLHPWEETKSCSRIHEKLGPEHFFRPAFLVFLLLTCFLNFAQNCEGDR